MATSVTSIISQMHAFSIDDLRMIHNYATKLIVEKESVAQLDGTGGGGTQAATYGDGGGGAQFTADGGGGTQATTDGDGGGGTQATTDGSSGILRRKKQNSPSRSIGISLNDGEPILDEHVNQVLEYIQSHYPDSYTESKAVIKLFNEKYLLFINFVKVLPFIEKLVDTYVILGGNTYSFKYSKNNPIPNNIATMMTKSRDNPSPVTTKLFMGLGSTDKSLRDITKALKTVKIRHHKIDMKKTNDNSVLQVFVHTFSAQYAKTAFDKKDEICRELGLVSSRVQFGYTSERITCEEKPVRKENRLSKKIYMGFGENQISDETIRESLATQDIQVLGVSLRETYKGGTKVHYALITTNSPENVRKAMMMKTELAEFFSIDSADFIVNAT